MSTFFLRPSRLKVSKLSQALTVNFVVLHWTFTWEVQPDNVTRQYLYNESCYAIGIYETQVKFEFRSTAHNEFQLHVLISVARTQIFLKI